MRTLVLRGTGLSVADAVAAVRSPTRLEIAPEARARVAASRAVIDRAVDEGRAVYGVTTGFGRLQNVAIAPAERARLQRNLVLSHAAGVGEPIPRDEARLLLLLRIQSLVRGHSGVTQALVDRLVRIYGSGIAPYVPAQGSVGASGDLAPLAHAALLVLGEGTCFAPDGSRVAAADALRAAGIEPAYVLREKEGLALLNGTQFMTALAATLLVRADHLLRLADLACATSLDALLFSAVPFDPRIHAARPHPGQEATAWNVRRLLEGSTILPSHAGPHKVQDAYCVRCAPQVHGAARDALRHVRDVVEREMNATTDNPLVFGDDGGVLSGGNFHGEPVALAADYAAIALAEIGSISERRVETLVNPDLSSGLPAFLARQAGVESGFMIAQVAAAALASEDKALAHPASVDSIPTSANQEDHVSMGPIAVRKAQRILRNVERIVGIELLAAAEGLEHRRFLGGAETGRSGAGVEAAVARLRRVVPPLSGDRILHDDFEAVDALIRDGSLVAAAEAAAGTLVGL